MDDGPLPDDVPIVTPAHELAEAITQLGEVSYSATYAGVALDAAADHLTLYTKDVVRGAQQVADARAQQAPGTPSTTTVEVKASKYSRTELEAARDTLWGQTSAGNAGVSIYVVAASGDGSGLRVTTNDASLAKQWLTSLDSKAQPPADVTFETGDAPVPADRYASTAPYFGGSYLRNSVTGCTSAFGIAIDSETYLVTAAHCFALNTGVWNGKKVGIGYVSAHNWITDSAVIAVNATWRVWVTNDQAATNGNAGSVYLNEQICQSGWSTSHTCNLHVVDTNVRWTFKDPPMAVEGAEACAPSGQIGLRSGDSGGPVYVGRTDGKLTSLGLASGGPTGGDPDRHQCMFFSLTKRILGVYSANLLTQ